MSIRAGLLLAMAGAIAWLAWQLAVGTVTTQSPWLALLLSSIFLAPVAWKPRSERPARIGRVALLAALAPLLAFWLLTGDDTRVASPGPSTAKDPIQARVPVSLNVGEAAQSAPRIVMKVGGVNAAYTPEAGPARSVAGYVPPASIMKLADAADTVVRKRRRAAPRSAVRFRQSVTRSTGIGGVGSSQRAFRIRER